MNPLEMRKDILSHVKLIVLKLGSSVVTVPEGLDPDTIRDLVDDVCGCRAQGKHFIIVSSGAVAAGVRRLNLRDGVKTIPQKQAAASVGQSRLMAAYEEAFARHGVQVGQMLLTKDDLTDRRRYLNARNTLTTLLSWDVVPIINENDTVAVEEIKFGDNDNLSALVATMAQADLLLTLSDIEGLMDCDPRLNPNACLIPFVEEITPELKEVAGDSSSGVGRGGMTSKLQAASMVRASGIPMIVTRGKVPGVIRSVIQGESCGTLFLPAQERMSTRKHWILYTLEPEGTLHVDSGAAAAIGRQGKSLLPIGVTGVEGHFDTGAAVSVVDDQGNRLAVGLANYASDEMERIRGHQTWEIDWILGYRRNDEAIHADNLVVLSPGNGGDGR
jgi:glutamate 5-kinase